MSGLTDFTFNSISSAPFYAPVAEQRERPAGTSFSLDGTALHSRANFVDGFYPTWTGPMLKATYDSLKTALDAKTQATLVTTYGSCTAILTKAQRIERPGVVTGFFLTVSLQWQRLTEWA